MTNYEKITKIIRKWHLALCKDNLWKYIIYTSIKQSWDIRSSPYYNNIYNCLDSLWETFQFKRKLIKENYASIEPYARPIEYYKPWDKVMVLSNAKDSPDYDYWDDEPKEMVGKWPFEVKDTDSSAYRIYDKDKSDYWYFGHHMLAPYFEEEEDNTELHNKIKEMEESHKKLWEEIKEAKAMLN